MARPRHSNKEIEAAVQFAESQGWRCHLARGHAWGRLFCPHGQVGGCIVSVYSTPRHAFAHAKYIKREIGKFPH
jgi:hypothetical protein